MSSDELVLNRLETKNIRVKTIKEMNTFINNLDEDFGNFYLFPVLKAALVELLLNAFKSYQKRKFFQDKELSMFSDYKYGNEIFKLALRSGEVDSSFSDELNFNIDVSIFRDNGYLNANVTNYVGMHDLEKKNVEEILNQNLQDGLFNVQSENINSEGAGIGLKILLLMLYKEKIPLENIRFESNDKSTKFSISLPID